MTNPVTVTKSTETATNDNGAIRLGGTFRLPSVLTSPTAVTDSGRIRLGGTFRLV